LRAFPDESSLIREIPKAKANDFMQFAEGRMKKKVMGAVEAIGEGVQKVIFADGRVEHPITAAINGAGTHIG
jgi:acetylglutamate/LysW-gamma-L-alpha-aminoadipate kinase